MTTCLDTIKLYLADLQIAVVEEDPSEELLIVDDEENGIKNLFIDCEEPIVIVEQLIMPVPPGNNEQFFKRLLQMNATLVHGAFLLDEQGKHVFFRDTLESATLDKEELESSIRSLALAMAEHGDELLHFNSQA
ncbi:MAG: YbjN domain-containing protein [Syntrophobacteraceae bacterium]